MRSLFRWPLALFHDCQHSPAGYSAGVFPVNIIHDKATQAGLGYLVIGGQAVNAYCEPRATLDVDLLVRKTDQERWRELLETEGFKPSHQGQTFLQFSPPYGTEWRLDLMLVNEETFAIMTASARPVQILGVATRIPQLEHLLALKLHALKHGHPERYEKDFMDVVALMRHSELNPRSAACRQLFAKFGAREIYEKVLERIT